MGLYDEVTIEDGVELPENIPRDISWQTKEFQNLLRTYRVTEDGKLLEEEFEIEEVPEDERPMYDEKIEGFEEKLHEAFGSLNWKTTGWSEKDYHGIIHAHQLIDEELVDIEIKFTDGELEEISVVE